MFNAWFSDTLASFISSWRLRFFCMDRYHDDSGTLPKRVVDTSAPGTSERKEWTLSEGENNEGMNGENKESVVPVKWPYHGWCSSIASV